MFKKVFLFCILGWGTFVVWQLGFSSNLFLSSGKKLTIDLTRGPLTVFAFPSKRPETRAVILFGSGDGGWSTLEESLGHACQDQGYEMIGIDSVAYAKTDYNAEILQSDFNTIAQQVRGQFGAQPPPLIIGGYSMGAAQAAAAAGGPHPPQGLVGLVVVDMLSRGRYGLRTADQMNLLPDGPGTFGLTDFVHTMPNLRVVQWHAGEDSIDSLAWLNSLTAPHREYTYPGDGHTYQNNRADFIAKLIQSIGWILEPKEPGPEAAKINLSHE